MKLFSLRIAMPLVRMGSCLIFVLAGEGFAQNFSGLNGLELQPRINSEAELAALLGDPGKQGNMIGSIFKVTVKTDSERQLVLSVSSLQLDLKILTGELHGTDGKRQTQILATSVAISPGSASTELTFNLDERLPQETRVESAVLHLFVANSSSASPSMVRSYNIAKKWQMEILPENMVTVVAPQPIEEATSLTERPIIVAVPPKPVTPRVPMNEGVLMRPRLVVPNGSKQVVPQ